MDPLSLTASIIAVLGLTKSCCKGLEKLNEGRKAPEEIGELLGELAGFQALLEEIKDFVEPKKDLRCGHQLKELVGRGSEFINEINILIQQTWPSIHFLKLSEANRQRVTILRNDRSSWKMTYHLPQFLMNRYLDFTVHHSPLDGPNLSVRMPRVVEWHHKLFRYANMGDVQAIQKLFSEGKASPYDVNPRGSNALIYAAAHGNPELGRFLLQAGADAELTDSCGRNPVELFFERALSGQFGPPDSHDHYLVKSMFKDTSFMEGRAFTTLHKIVLGFVARDLKEELAVSTSSINDCDSNGRTALCWATICDDQTAVENLLAFGASPNISDYTALHSFCKKDGPVEIIGLLIDAGIEVDVRDADGETPLLNAIFRGFTAAAEELLERGANPNASNISSRDTSIHFAVGFDRYEILPLLLARGVDYIATNVRGRHIGHMAARVASARTIQILSSSNLTGLDLLLKDSYGNTAADYLSSRKVSSQSELGIHAAFAHFQKSCGFGNLCAGPDRPKEKLMDLDDVEAQDVEEKRQPPGAFPEPAGQHNKLSRAKHYDSAT
ncbi:MAG: hypothetical protein L6R38_004061 [Xanthoria sp. 2 TBL-2021]|nr:MAG: hypothetical protein L6R38_004061 [Xanthoria sp. 2 TBL-2021]